MSWTKEGLTWYYHTNGENRYGLQKIYIDHLSPSKGWRVAIVGKYETRSVYFRTKKDALEYAREFMKIRKG